MALIDMATILSQTPFVQNVAGAQQSIPAAQQASLEQAFHQTMELQKSQVQKVEKSEDVEAVSKDREKEKKERHYAAAGKKGPEHETSQQAVETTASNASPWSGNIIDVKI
jgi:preprotein translocase subunit SecF